jgi:hypothetical protein
VELSKVASVASQNARRLGLVRPGIRRDGRYRVTVLGAVELDSTVTLVDEAVTGDAAILLALVGDGLPVVARATHAPSGEHCTDVTIGPEAIGRWSELTAPRDCVRLG